MRRSASTLPSVWQPGQYCRDESAKLTSAMDVPHTGQGSPVRACTCRLLRLSSLRSFAARPRARSTEMARVPRSASKSVARSASSSALAALKGLSFAAHRISSE